MDKPTFVEAVSGISVNGATPPEKNWSKEVTLRYTDKLLELVEAKMAADTDINALSQYRIKENLKEIRQKNFPELGR